MTSNITCLPASSFPFSLRNILNPCLIKISNVYDGTLSEHVFTERNHKTKVATKSSPKHKEKKIHTFIKLLSGFCCEILHVDKSGNHF